MDALPRSVRAAIAEHAAPFIDAATPGLGIAVVRDGAVAWAGGLGVADPATGRAVDAETRFRIASVTKTFTATVILRLRDAGLLALDDPLTDHLPEAAAIREVAGRRSGVTIGRILLHTAGLAASVPVEDPGALPELRPDALLARLDHVEIVRPPGERWSYGNLGYELLAIVAERIAGIPYPALLARELLGPLGLTSTSYLPDRARDATGRMPLLPGEPTQVARAHDEQTHRGDGGLWASPKELAGWLAAQCRGMTDAREGDPPPILRAETLRLAHRPLIPVDPGWTLAQGLGWAFERIDSAVWSRHTGSLSGFRSIVLVRPADGIGVVALANGSVRPNEVAQAIARALLAERRHESRGEVGTVPAGGDADPGLRPFLGTWAEPAYGLRVEIAAGPDGLSLAEPGGTESRPLLPTADPLTWRIGGDGGPAGELARFAVAPDGAIGILNVAGQPYRRSR